MSDTHEQVLSSRQRQWAQIVSQSERMLELANAGEWDQLATVERERHTCLQAYFAIPATARESAQLRKSIEAILKSDQQVLSASRDARQSVSEALVKLGQQRQAHKAYTSYSG